MLGNLSIYITASEQAQASFSSNATQSLGFQLDLRKKEDHCQWTDISGDSNFSMVRDELYGSSVAMSKDGQRIANVGSIESVNGPIASYVEVKQYDGNEWNLLGLPITTPTIGSRVSDDVGLSGDGSVLVFATLYITLSEESVGDVSMYKYSDEGKQWEPLGNSIPGGKIGNFAGLKVSVSDDGDTVAIGSRYFGSKGLIERGRVRVFRFNSLISTWEQIGSSIIGETNLNHMGSDVELSPDGSHLIVGATGQELARIYSYDNGIDTWVQIGTDITGEISGDWSGFSVGISVTNTFIRVAIGAILNDGGEGEDTGSVRLYDYNSISGQWEQVGADIKGEDGETLNFAERYYHVGDRAGFSLSLSDDGNRIAVGSPFNNANTEYYGGHTRLFDLDRQTNDWAEVAENIFIGNDSYTLSGYSLDMSRDGNFLIIGVPGIDSRGGFGRSSVNVWRGCGRMAPQPSQMTSSPSVSISPSQGVATRSRSPTKPSASPTILAVVVYDPKSNPTATPRLLPSEITSSPSISLSPSQSLTATPTLLQPSEMTSSPSISLSPSQSVTATPTLLPSEMTSSPSISLSPSQSVTASTPSLLPSEMTSSPSISISPSQGVTASTPSLLQPSEMTSSPSISLSPSQGITATPTLLPSEMTSSPSISISPTHGAATRSPIKPSPSPTSLPVFVSQPISNPTTTPTSLLIPEPSVAPSFELSSPPSVHQTQVPSPNVTFSPPSSIPTCYYNIENDDYDFTEEENVFLNGKGSSKVFKSKGYKNSSPKSSKGKGYGSSPKSSKANKGNYARDQAHSPGQTERRINTKKTNTKSKGSISDEKTISSKGKAGAKSKGKGKGGSFSGCKKVNKYNSKKKGKGKGHRK